MVIEKTQKLIADAILDLQELQNTLHKNKHFANAIEYLNKASICLVAYNEAVN